MHQVVALHVGLCRRRERDRARVVDADVDTAEALDRFGDGVGHLIFVTDIAL
jgi:hypothetical protein